jgi:hypothetical protein
MAGLDSKSFDEPDEVLELPFFSSRIVTLGEVHVAWTVTQPGWRWRPGGRSRGAGRRPLGRSSERQATCEASRSMRSLASPDSRSRGRCSVSEAAGGLLEGSGLSLEDGGEHELTGLSGPRRLYRLAD